MTTPTQILPQILPQTRTVARAESNLPGIAAVFLAGAILLFFSGYAQSTVLHDAAHDIRHAMAFPCH